MDDYTSVIHVAETATTNELRAEVQPTWLGNIMASMLG